MRLDMFCKTCLFDKNTIEHVSLDLRDDGTYTRTCSRGHVNTEIVQQQPFETLFEIGAHAIFDSYYREAVSSFSASLERFYEFSTHVLLLNSGKSNKNFEDLWKPLRRFSERQLGAFVAIWMTTFGDPPALLPDGERGRKFRNDVVHNGKIPSRDEAIEYGQVVLDLIRSQMRALKDLSDSSIQDVVFYRLHNLRRDLGEANVGTACYTTLVSLSSSEISDVTVRDYMSAISTMREMSLTMAKASKVMQQTRK